MPLGFERFSQACPAAGISLLRPGLIYVSSPSGSLELACGSGMRKGTQTKDAGALTVKERLSRI